MREEVYFPSPKRNNKENDVQALIRMDFIVVSPLIGVEVATVEGVSQYFDLQELQAVGPSCRRSI